MKLKIEWSDYIVLILFLCGVISILVDNVWIKMIFVIVELIIALISTITLEIISRKEVKKFRQSMEKLKEQIEGEFKDVD